MRLFGREIEGFPQALVICVTVLLVASGLCGVQWGTLVIARGRAPVLTSIFTMTGVLELAAMACAVLGTVAIVIAWPISVLAGRLYDRHGKPQKDSVQRLFEDLHKHDRPDTDREDPHD